MPEVLADVERVLARHGRAARRHQVPRRFRAAPEGRAQAAQGQAERDPVHRRDPHASSAPARRRAARWTRPTCSSRRSSSGALQCIGATTFTEYRGIFEKDRALSRRFQKIDVRRADGRARRSRSCKGLKTRFEEHHGVKYAPAALQAAAELSAQAHQRPSPARQGDRRDRRGRRAPSASCRSRSARRPSTRPRSRRSSPRSRAFRRQAVSSDDRGKLQTLERDLKSVVFGQDQAIDALASAIKMARSGLGNPRQADRLLPVRRPHRRRQDRGRQAARLQLGIELIRFDMSEYMERHAVIAPDRRASGLRRLRPGRPADRGDHEEAALRAAARRDREGAPGHLQHAAAGHGPRHADRQQRAQGRLPQRDHRHDDQRRRRDACNKAHDRLHQRSARPATRWPTSSACSRRSSATAWTRSCSFKALDEEIILRVVDKFLIELEDAAAREEGRGHVHRRRCASSSPRRASIR